MKTTLLKYSLLLLFTLFSLHIHGMKKQGNFTKETNKQLLSIIKTIPITHQRHYGDMIKYPNVTSYLICINKVSHNGETLNLDRYDTIQSCESNDRLENTNNFDVRPIEDMVLKHMNGSIPEELVSYKTEKFLNYWKYLFDENKYKYPQMYTSYSYQNTNYLDLITVKYIGLVNKNIPSLKKLCLETLTQNISQDKLNELKKNNSTNLPIIINYLLYDDKAPNIMAKDKIIKHYVSFSEQNQHITNIRNQNKNFIGFLERHFYNENQLYKTFTDEKLPIVKEIINDYLNEKGSILLPLIYCILHNDRLFSDFDTSDNKNIWPSLNKSQFKKAKELTNWLLIEKGGQHYLKQLLYKCIIEKYFEPKIFMHSLALVEAYNLLETTKKNLNSVMYNLIKNNKVNIIEMLINLKLCTNQVLNETLTLAGKEKNFDIVKLLLKHSADPNKLFYRDKENNKRCLLCCARYEDTQLLINLLLNKFRIIDKDEPTDFEYLTHPKDQNIKTIQSIFVNNNKKIGQQEIYEYAMEVYKLAFEAQKTGDPKKLREHIINQYKKQSIWYKLNYRFGKTIRKIKDFTIYTGLTTLSILGLYLFIKFSPI